jgi:hypothetical protein
MLRVLASATLLSAISTTAFAQSPWNRQVTGIAVTPDDAGSYDVHAAWTVSVAPTSDPLNLGLIVELRRNGVTVAATPHTVEVGGGSGTCATGGCSGTCGNSTIDGLYNDLFCVPDECDCRSLDRLTTFGGVPVVPGDEIMVILYPAPGALPEPDTSDDAQIRVFDGDPLYWDRAVTDVHFVSAPGARQGTYDLHLDLALYSRYDAVDKFTTQVAVLVSGTPTGGDFSPFDNLTLAVCPAGCNGPCGYDPDGLPVGICEIIGEPPEPWMNPPCPCFTFGEVIVPAVALTPGDEITVILYPSPGALPDLPVPGFSADDTLTRTFYETGDLNCDGAVNFGDINPFVLYLSNLSAWQAAYADCPAEIGDINGDGSYPSFDDINPFVALLSGGN